jgi:hypothetical protein
MTLEMEEFRELEVHRHFYSGYLRIKILIYTPRQVAFARRYLISALESCGKKTRDILSRKL